MQSTSSMFIVQTKPTNGVEFQEQFIGALRCHNTEKANIDFDAAPYHILARPYFPALRKGAFLNAYV